MRADGRRALCDAARYNVAIDLSGDDQVVLSRIPSWVRGDARWVLCDAENNEDVAVDLTVDANADDVLMDNLGLKGRAN
jgi:hypothetical protein